jgi:hypothetical protein
MFNCCKKNIKNISENPEYLKVNFLGKCRKNIPENMVCFL